MPGCWRTDGSARSCPTIAGTSSTLRDEGAVAKRLMRVLGTSAYVPELLMRAPEVIQHYADGPNGPKLLEVEPDAVARALVASAARHADPVRAIAAARTLRRRELARDRVGGPARDARGG